MKKKLCIYDQSSSYDSGKIWAKEHLTKVDSNVKVKLYDKFMRYKSIDTKVTDNGEYLTSSKREFYYGCANYLKSQFKK